jgi:hypothetical protein
MEHARYVLDGKVAPILLWEKHPAFLAAVAIMALTLLMMFKRLVFGRRAKVVVQRVEASKSNAPPIKTRPS